MDRDVYYLGEEQLADSCEQIGKLFGTSRSAECILFFKKDCAVLIWSPTAVK